MVVNCVIEFDGNHCGTFFAGQVISGKVTLEADKPKQVKGTNRFTVSIIIMSHV